MAAPYEEFKQQFFEELDEIMENWDGPTVLGGDFNLVRNRSEKTSGNVNSQWTFCFNDRINRFGLIELKVSSKKYTWANNQDNLIVATLDKIFVTTHWESKSPRSLVEALPKYGSDHTPLLLDSGENVRRPEKVFKFEKWWLYEEAFANVVQQAWNAPCGTTDPMDIWQTKLRLVRKKVKGWDIK